MDEKDKLFYEDAKKALEEDEGPKPSLLKRPAVIILGLIVVLILIASFIPLYSVKVNPPPDREVIKDFHIASNDKEMLENLNESASSTINGAISKLSPQDYRSVSVGLSTDACETSSKLCYAKALYYYSQNNIRYINDPAAREYVQLPGETMLSKAGDCDDKSVLLATLLESIGIDADVGITSNHAFVRAKVDAPFWISRNGYVYLDPSSSKDFGEVSFRDEEVIRFYEIY